MEVKIHENSTINSKKNSVKTIKSIGTSFSDIFNKAINDSKNNIPTNDTTSSNEAITKSDFNPKDIKTGNILIDTLPDKNKFAVLDAIKKLNNIFGINILGDPDKFINKKDSTINLTRILDLYGDKVRESDLNDLSDSINTLKDNGLISDEDYFSALKWIATKQEAFKIKMQNEKNKDSISNLMWKPKKS